MILIGIPYHPAKRYALDHLMDWLEQQHDYEVIMRIDTGEYGRPGALKSQFEYLRLLASTNPLVEYLYICEADTIPPKDVIERLKAHQKPIVGALYHYRSEDKPTVAWPKDKLTDGLVQVDGMGTGAVLLDREVLDKFSFYDWPQPDCDYPMYDALKAKGYGIWLDMDLVCKHYINDKEYA